MARAPVGVGGALARLAFLVVLSAVSGALVAALALPAVGGAGIVTRNAIGTLTFSELPPELRTPPLSQRSVIKAADGTTLATFYYENRQSVDLSEVSPIMRQAIVAIEDARFYEHHGVDPKGIARALVKDSSTGQAAQGASTITQQYVRQALVETSAQNNDIAAANAASAKNLTRKLREARYALALEQKLTKDQILEDYLNTVYFGSGAYGISAAAQHYFSEPVSALTLAQSALLAGVINNPSTFDPLLNPNNATERRNIVLDRMLATYPAAYTPAEIDAAKQAPLGLNKSDIPNGCSTATAPFFCDYVVHDILNGKEFGATVDDRANLLRRGGLVVTTTLDPATQTAAQNAVEAVVPRDPSKNAGLAAAIDMLDPKTGAIKAMAVDRDYGSGLGQTELNLAADYYNHGGSRGRHAGSTFKVFVLAAALEKKLPTGLTINSPPKVDIKAGSTTTCEGLPTAEWKPQNAEASEGGTFNMVNATAQSVNTYFAQLEVLTGLCEPITIAQNLGVKESANGGPLEQVPAFVLGSEDVDPLSVAGAFAALANQGTFCAPRAITGVTVLLGDVDTPLRNVPGPDCKPVLDPGVANGVTTLLEHVLLPGGTGGGLDVGRQAAAKTGTDDDYKNAWFSGYTPNLAASVWVGNPDSTTPMRAITVNGKAIPRVFGATLPGPIWQSAMKGALANLPVETFQAASDLVLRGPPITMPNVVGQDPVVATPTLTALGLVVTPIAGATQVPSLLPQGQIDSTVPAGGTVVYAGQVVKLNISSGVPPPTPTPTDIPPASLPPGVTPSDSASPSASASATGTPSPSATPTPKVKPGPGPKPKP